MAHSKLVNHSLLDIPLYQRLLLVLLPDVLIIGLLWLTWFQELTSAYTKLVQFALGIQILLAIIYGTAYGFKRWVYGAITAILYTKMFIIFILLLPMFGNNHLYILLPVWVVVGAYLFLGPNERRWYLITSVLLFMVASGVFTVTDRLQEAGTTIGANLFSMLLIAGVLYRSDVRFLRQTAIGETLIKKNEDLRKKVSHLQKHIARKRQTLETLSRDVKRRDLEIKNIITLSGQVNVREDIHKSLSKFMLTAVGQLGASHAVILTRPDEKQNYIAPLVEKGLGGQNKSIKIYLDSQIINILQSIQDPVPARKIPRSSLYEDEIALLNRFDKDLFVPIMRRKYLHGLLIIGQKVSAKPFSREDLDLVAIIAQQIVFVLEQWRLNANFQEFYSGTIRALLRSLETKYIYARGHNYRTAKMVNILARKLELPGKDIIDFSYGALLHDIGKIAIKDEYLFDPSRFSPANTDKKEKILAHTVEGSKILKSAGFNDAIIDLALHHHEFYGGGGYPDKIGSDELSLGARLLSVCNAYDAMISARPYRNPLSPKVARTVLQENVGQQFDPEMVKLFMDELKRNPKMGAYN